MYTGLPPRAVGSRRSGVLLKGKQVECQGRQQRSALPNKGTVLQYPS